MVVFSFNHTQIKHGIDFMGHELMKKKKPVKKPKKITKKKQLTMARTSKRRRLTEWSKAVRDRDQKCVVCGRTDYLNAHHILPKENYKEFMFEVINGVTLCPTHHKFGKYSAHKNPIWFAVFLQIYYLEQWEWATTNAGPSRGDSPNIQDGQVID